jgi:cysteine-rich repeat protein
MRTLSVLQLFAFLAIASMVTPASATVADDLCSPAADPCVVDTTLTLSPGSDIDLGGRALHFGGSARVTVGAGTVTISAGPVRLLPDARITGSSGIGGSNLEVRSTGAISMDATSRIDLSAEAIAGGLLLQAASGITVAGDVLSIGRDDEADGGFVLLDGGAGDVVITGSLSVKGGGLSGGGSIFVMADGDVDLAQIVNVSGGDFGGGDLDITTGGNVIVRKDVLADGGGFSGDGGSLSIDARGNATILGSVQADAAGDSEEGGGFGGDVEIVADGDVSVAGKMDLTGAFPDGEGGTFFVQAGGSFSHASPIQLTGPGIDGCGGSLDVSTGRDATLARIDATGGSCGGGDLSVEGLGTVTVNGIISSDTTVGFGSGGLIALKGRDLVTNEVVRAIGGSQGESGIISLEGCNVTVNKPSEIRTTGGLGGSNTVRASGQATIVGKLLSANGGINVVEFRDPTLPPIVSGQVDPPTMPVLNPTLPPCPGASAACGDGTLDTGEECDDGNTTACDGCGPSCRLEECGNGRVECDEECDAGALNGVAGSGCDAACKVVVEPGGLLLLPGGRATNSCMAEWRIKNPGGAVSNGFPSKTQSCIDGDPTCDQDGAIDGKCAFQVGVCVRVTDARLPDCNPQPVDWISIHRPNELDPLDAVDGANGIALRDILAGLGLTVKGGSTVLVPGVPDSLRDHCSADAAIMVPHPAGFPGSRVLNISARGVDGARMRENKVTLTCLPNTSVCGNGMREVGEQCDDGNRDSCDGCTATCRVEICGDGIVECGEQCDEGPANGTPGGECTAQCTEVIPTLRIPGGGSKRTDCLLEASVDVQTPTLKRDGTPSNKQICVDNDPGCDFDPNPGTCQFHAWLCLAGSDARISCAADSVVSTEVRKPNERDTGDRAALRQAALQRLGALSLPLAPGERCTSRIDVDVRGRKEGKLSVRVQNPVGKKDTDTLKFKCVPPKP